MPTIDLMQVTLRYELSGRPSAPVLLLSNSLGTTLEMWQPQLQSLEASFRVLRYDMRGHGGSSVPAGPYSIAQLGHDMLALLDALGFAQVDFCGLSIGGVIGQWLAINAPQRISRLILCNTAAKIGTPEAWETRIAKVQQEGMASILDGVMERWFTASFRAANLAAVSNMRDILATTDPAGYLAACAALRDMDQRDAVSAICHPTLILAGEQDMVTTLDDAHFLATRIPSSTVESLPAAHISNVEAPVLFIAAVLKFLHQERAT